MADNNNVLSARLEVKDSFSSQLNKFAKALNSTETAFNKFMNRIQESSSKLGQSLDRITNKMEQTSNKIISQNDKVANSILKSTTKVEQSQQKAMDNLLKKYEKMGTDIDDIFKKINKDAETLSKSGIKINTGSGGSGNGHSMSGMSVAGNTEYALTSMIGGNFQMMLMQLGVIGGAVLGANKILTTLDGWAQQGFNALNSLSTGLLSYDGLKEGIQSAGEFQTNRIAMNVLYGNDPVKGQQYYQMGTALAKDTPYSEVSVGELQKKLGGAGIEYNQKDLMTLLDIASIKPELGADHVGFSIVDSMGGRPSSLKMNYMLDNKAMNEYLKKLKTSNNPQDRANAQKWKDAFTKTGTVGNKQDYFDLLIDYVRNQTKYNGLTNQYAHTVNGLVDRLQGNWETLRADLLGIDANGTGLAKTGQITVFSSLNDFIQNLEEWFEKDSTKSMLQGIGNGLGKGINAITTALQKLMADGNFEKVGKVFEDIGNSVADFIERLNKNGTLDKIIEKLPDLMNVMLNNEAIKLESQFNTGASFATGDFGGGIKNWVTGKQLQVANFMGDKNANWNTVDELSKNKSLLNQWWDNYTNYVDSNMVLTDANASAVLSKNPNLNDDQRQTIQEMIKNDTQNTYNNITVHEIKADNFEEIMASLRSYMDNSN